MATVTERLAILVEANAGKAIAEFKALGGATKGLSGDVGKAGGLLAKFGGSAGSLVGSAGATVAVGAVGLAFAKFSADGVTAFTELAGQVKEFRRVAGGTAEDASKLVAAFKSVGVDASTAAGGVFMLEKKLAASADKLAAFGVVAVKDAKGNTDMSQTLLSVGDAYKRIHDPVQKAALLTAAFGRQGKDLIPLLGKSREEIEHFFDAAAKHHEILSSSDLKLATDYKLAMHDLSEAFTGLQREAGKALIPFITDTAKAITKTIELIDHVHTLIGMKPGTGAGGIGEWLDGLRNGKDATDDVTTATGSLTAALGETIGYLDQWKKATDDEQKSMDALDKSISTMVDSDRALVDSKADLADAESALSALQAKTAVDTEKVADAQRSLAEATRAVGHAQREQRDAQKDYNQAAKAADILGTDTALEAKQDAADNLADANDGVADAQDRAKAAAVELKKAQAGDPEFQTKLADAVKKVAAAKDDVSKKALASVLAHGAETKAVSDNASQIERLLAGYKEIIRLHPEVAAALAPQIAALPAAPAPAPPPPPSVDKYPSINSGETTNNVTVNVNSDRPIDPTHLSRTVIWSLN